MKKNKTIVEHSRVRYHLPRVWERITNIKIIDPDGWRDGTSWNKPINFTEWERRMMESTVCPMTDYIN